MASVKQVTLELLNSLVPDEAQTHGRLLALLTACCVPSERLASLSRPDALLLLRQLADDMQSAAQVGSAWAAALAERAVCGAKLEEKLEEARHQLAQQTSETERACAELQELQKLEQLLETAVAERERVRERIVSLRQRIEQLKALGDVTHRFRGQYSHLICTTLNNFAHPQLKLALIGFKIYSLVSNIR